MMMMVVVGLGMFIDPLHIFMHLLLALIIAVVVYNTTLWLYLDALSRALHNQAGYFTVTGNATFLHYDLSCRASKCKALLQGKHTL